MAFWVLDDNNNKVEAFDKEGVLALLEQAIEEGTLANILADSGFISKIKCCVSGTTNKIAFVSQAKYNELKNAELLQPNAWYFITDDETAETINETLETALNNIDSLSRSLFGRFENGGNVCHYARITNFTNADIPERIISGDSEYAFFSDEVEEVYFDKPCYAYWQAPNGQQYSLGIIAPPRTPSDTGIIYKTYSHSALSVYLMESTTGQIPYFVQAQVSKQKYLRNTIPYYKYSVKVQTFAMAWESSGLNRVNNLDFAGGSLIIRPIQ